MQYRNGLLRKISRCFFLTVLLAAAPLRATADCGPQWLPGSGIPGIDGNVQSATSWDPDGPGPLPVCLTVGGSFRFPDGAASSVAYWSGTEWVRVPGLFGGDVETLLALPDGRLVAGGFFSYIDSQTLLPPIVVWNGTSWAPIGTRSEFKIARVYAIKQLPNGDLVAAGVAASTVLNGRGIARWDGSTWSPLGTTGIPGFDTIRSLVFMPNGDLVAAGKFSTIDGLTVNGTARWDGAVWSALSTGLSGGSGARAAVVTDSGDLVVGGAFNTAGGVAAPNLAKWDGAAWSAVGSTPVQTLVTGIVALPGGNLVISGGFVGKIASKWDGGAWSAIANGWASSPIGGGTVRSLSQMPDGRIILGGSFEGFDNLGAVNVASFEAGAWTAFGSGTDNYPRVFATLSDGRLVAAGNFRSINGVAAKGIAIFDGATWAPLSSGVEGTISALAELPDGRLVAGGSFTSIGGVAANCLAIWDWSSWAPLGSGPSGFGANVSALYYAPNNLLYIGGSFSSLSGVAASRVASWNGSTFAALGSGADNSVSSFTWYSGALVVGGDFESAGGSSNARRVAKWNGSAWSSLSFGITGSSNGIQSVDCLATTPEGDLLVGGLFDLANISNGLGKWNGANWTSAWGAEGSGGVPSVSSLLKLPNGDLIATGFFNSVNSVPAMNIARRDHVTGTWSALGTGANGYNSDTAAVGRYGNGFFVSGLFLTAGDHLNGRLAYYADDASPQIAHSPTPVDAGKGETVVLSAVTAPGYPGTSFQWQRETAPMSEVFADITNGPGGATPSGGEVSGASGVLPSPTNTNPLVLNIAHAKPADSARYRVVVNGDCGSNASSPAQVTVVDNCPADLNADSLVDDADFVVFAAAYNLLDCTDPTMPAGCPADLNNDSFVDDVDFVIFVAAYNELVCP